MRWSAVVSLVALGCSADPAPAPSPKVAPAAEAPEVEPTADVAPVSCDPGLAGLGCAADERCAALDADAPFGLEAFVCLAHRHRATTLGAVLAQTPIAFRKNFTAKHGVPRPGERGHAYEQLESFLSPQVVASGQSASPTAPRTLMWDESTGFTISFNGDAPGQSGGGRLDLMRFDADRDAFELWALDLPLTHPLRPYQPHTEHDDCAHCHGPHGRPIWPMYPDWPGFYGSDNDELTSDSTSAQDEGRMWAAFRGQASGDRFAGLFAPALERELREHWPSLEAEVIAAYAQANPRNVSADTSPAVFEDPASLRDWLGLRLHPSFPFRPDHQGRSASPSRAFFHRPNLRLGVLYNRLLVRRLMAQLGRDPAFVQHQRFVAFTVMDCDWGDDGKTRAAARAAFGEAVAGRGVSIGPDTEVRLPLLLAALGSSVREVDMRFSHSNPAYDIFDDPTAQPLAAGVMDLGFIAYAESDLHAVAGSDLYFNSYFDGTATFDELWAARMLDALAAEDPGLAAVYVPNSLTHKYARFAPRMALDAAFFAQMDSLGTWMPLPYPRHLRHPHDREPFYKRAGGRRRFIEPYLAVCSELRRGLRVELAEG